MGLFDFFKKKDVVELTEVQLREALFNLVASNNLSKEFLNLCDQYREVISTSFKKWQKMPEEMQSDPNMIQWYGQGMMVVAQYFDQGLGDPSLLQLMMGAQEDNPISAWQDQLQQSSQAIEAEEYDSAVAILKGAIEEFSPLKGSGADLYLPITYGKLAEAYFQSGRSEEALGPTLKAIELCEAAEDIEGLFAYNSNICEMYRYLGRGEQAALHAAKLADLYEKSGDISLSNQYKSRAKICKEGEPLLRVVVSIAGQKYELSEIENQNVESCQFIFERNRITLEPCKKLVNLGMSAGSKNEFDDALLYFKDAAQKDLYSPEPYFHLGFTLAHLKKYAEALKAYEEVERRAPGWYHSRVDSYLVQQILNEVISHDDWLVLIELEDGNEPLEHKLTLANRLNNNIPSCSIVLYHLASISQKMGHDSDALKHGLEALDCVDCSSLETRILLILGLVHPDKVKKAEYLQKAYDLNGDLIAAASAKVCLLKKE